LATVNSDELPVASIKYVVVVPSSTFVLVAATVPSASVLVTVLPSPLIATEPPPGMATTVLPSPFSVADNVATLPSAAVVVTLPSSPTSTVLVLPSAAVTVTILPPLLTTSVLPSA
jgi:hypothetical protein